MADIKTAVVRYQLPQVTGNFTVSLPGGQSWTPKACKATLANSFYDDTVGTHASICKGFTDGTNEAFVWMGAEDNVGTSNCNRDQGTDAFINFLSPTSPLVTTLINVTAVTGTGVGPIAGGWVFDVTAEATSVERYCIFEFFGGADYDAHVGTLTPNGTQNGTLVVTAPGHTPTFVEFAATAQTEASGPSNGGLFSNGYAWNDTSPVNVGIGYNDNHNLGITDIDQIHWTNRCVGQVNTSGAVGWAGEVTAFSASGFTLTTRDGATGGDEAIYMSVELTGGDCWVGSADSPTVATAEWTISGPSFRPCHHSMVHSVTTASDTVEQRSALYSFGVSDGERHVSCSIMSQRNVTTSNCHSWNRDGAMIKMMNASNAIQLLYAAPKWTDSGVSFPASQLHTVNGTARKTIHLVIGADDARDPDVKVLMAVETLPTSTDGTGSFDIPLPGAEINNWTPKACLVTGAWNREDTDEEIYGHVLMFVGFNDGVRECCASLFSDDAVGTTLSYRELVDTDTILFEGQTTEQHRADGAIQDGAIGPYAGGWKFDFTTAAYAGDVRVTFTFFGGTDFDAYVDTGQVASTLNGTTVVTSPQHEPDLVLFTCVGDASVNTRLGHAMLSFGAAENDTTIVNRGIGYVDHTSYATSDVDNVYWTDRCMGQVYTGSELWAGEVTAFSSTGFTVTSRDTAPGATDAFGYMTFKLPASFSLWLGDMSMPTSGSVAWEPGPSFRPNFMIGNWIAPTGADTVAAGGGFAIGQMTRKAATCCAIICQDSVGTSNTASVHKNGAFVYMHGGAQALLNDIGMPLMSDTGVSFPVSQLRTIEGVARRGWGLAFGDNIALTEADILVRPLLATLPQTANELKSFMRDTENVDWMPKAVIVVSSRAHTTVDVIQEYNIGSIGFSDGARENVVSWRADDNQATTNTFREQRTDQTVNLNSAGTNVWLVAMSSVGGSRGPEVGGWRMDTVQDNTGVDHFATIILLGGMDFDGRAGTGAVQTTQDASNTVNFGHDTTAFIGTTDVQNAYNAMADDIKFSFGIAADTPSGIVNKGVGFYDEDNVGTSNVTAIHWSDRLLGNLNGTTESWTVEVTDFASGVEFTTREGSAGLAHRINGLSIHLQKGQLALLDVALPLAADIGSDWNPFTDFEPCLSILAMEQGTTKDVGTAGRFSFGFSASDGEHHHSINQASADNVGTSDGFGHTSNDFLKWHYAAGRTVGFEFDGVTFDENGLTVPAANKVVSADSAGRHALLFLISREFEPAAGGTTGVLRQAVDSTRHGFQPVMASRLGGVLVH